MTTAYKQLEKDLEEVEGDSTLYAGMLAYVGDAQAAGYTKQCVDWAGQIWRYPEADLRGQYKNSSSRDMFMGALLGCTHTLTKLEIASYLKVNKGLLCPEASDNRNKVGVMGWAQLGVVLGKDASPSTMGLKGFLLSKIFRPLLGPVALLEALTVYEKYQINLVYCALMLYRRHGVAKWWENKILSVIKNVRNQDDMVLRFLEGRDGDMYKDLPNLEANRERVVKNNELAKDWPLDSFGFHYPSAVYVRWVKAAVKAL